MKNNLTIETNNDLFIIHYMFENGNTDLCELKHIPKLIANSKGVSKITILDGVRFKRISFKNVRELLIKNKIDMSPIQHLKHFQNNEHNI